MPNTTADQLERWGMSAADDFTTCGAALNDSIQKIASDNGLNKEQIQRVCEFANLKVYDHMMKTASDKRVEFPLADVFSIVSNIKDIPDIDITGMSDKISSVDFAKLAFVPAGSPSDVFLSPELKMQLGQQYLDKVAHKQVPIAAKVDAFLKLAEMKDKIKAKEVELDSKSLELKNNIKNVSKQLMESGHSFQDLYNIAVQSDPKRADKIKVMFDEIAEDFKKDGTIPPTTKLSAARLINIASAIVKSAMIADDASEHTTKTLQARKQLVMFTGEKMEVDNEHAKSRNVVDYLDRTVERARGKMKSDSPLNEDKGGK